MDKVARPISQQASRIEAVACPGCGLLCDDIVIDRSPDNQLKVAANGCAKSIAFFERPLSTATPRINGTTTDIDSAVARAAEVLGNARHPLIGGLGTDVQGMRAVMNLAGTAGATLDHMNSKSSMRNLFVLQNSGWQITTLTEVRNRVDLLVIVGTDVVSYFPRFFERNVWNKESMFGQDTAAREIVYLGGRNIDTSAGIAPDGRQPTVLPCDQGRIPEALAALRAIASGKPVAAMTIAGIATADLRRLAERLTNAKYSVIAWAASALDFPHAELAIQNIAGIVATLNQTTRSAGLPLSGSDGDLGVYNTSAWISGYPFRSSYRRDHPDYDPYHYSTERMLAAGEADTLLWISSFSPERVPPATSVPTVVFGHPSMQFEREPEVFIPVAVPGMDCTGTQFRSDSSVALPLKKLRNTQLPRLDQVLVAIEAKLPKKEVALKKENTSC
jgi:formylmethanofuran dehydrogenase subunit B